MKKTHNVYVDIGNTYIKFGLYLKSKFLIKQIKCVDLDQNEILTFLKSFKSPLCFYLVSVNEKSLKKLIAILETLTFKYIVIKHKDVYHLKKLFIKKINFNQVGMDLILSSYYLTDYSDCLICLLGTVFVFIYKQQLINGFLFLPNIFTQYENLVNNFNFSNENIYDIKLIPSWSRFGHDNQTCIQNSFIYCINGFLNEIINQFQTDIKQIILSGGCSYLIKNILVNNFNLPVIEIDNSCIYGLKKLIEN